MNLRAIKWYLNAIISPCGLLINILLLFLIKNKSSENLKDYKKILYMGCITDIIYGIIMFFATCSVALIQGVYFVFTEGVLGNLPHTWSTWAFIPNLFIMYIVITNSPIQFLYRYLLLCWEIKLRTMAFLGLFGISILACSCYCYFWIAAILSRGYKDELYYASLLNGTEWVIEGQIPNYGAFPMKEKIFDYGWICIVIVSVSYVMVWFCAISIYIKLRKMKNQFSEQTMKYQSQINLVLIVETLTPFITVVIPVTLDIIIAILGMYVYWAGQTVTLISVFSPPINGLVKITAISCYRKTILEFFFKIKNFIVSSVFGGIEHPFPPQNGATLASGSSHLGGEVGDESFAARCFVKIV